MPVRFFCQRCHQLLSVGRRKIGAQVSCPTCGSSNVVPDQWSAQAGVAMATSVRPAANPLALPEFVVYEDLPTHHQRLLPGPVAGLDIPGGTTGSCDPAAANRRRHPDAGGAGRVDNALRPAASPPWTRGNWVLLSRRAVYAQAALLATVALVFGLAGFFIGRSRQPTSPAQPVESVVVSGQLSAAGDAPLPQPDAGALAIALPADRSPARPLPAGRLNPRHGPAADATAAAAIQQLGGDCVWADASGQFHLVVPRPGRYHVLFVSRSARRPQDRKPDEADLAVLAAYFDRADPLLGDAEYALSTRHIGPDAPVLRHVFAAR